MQQGFGVSQYPNYIERIRGYYCQTVRHAYITIEDARQHAGQLSQTGKANNMKAQAQAENQYSGVNLPPRSLKPGEFNRYKTLESRIEQES